jgi:ferredoxin-NADP reductase
VGDFVLAGKPAGDFVLSASERPVVLLSAGIGITPMGGMLYALRTDHRSVYFIHGVRTPGQMALMDEVREFTDSSPRQTLTILASAQGPQDLAVSDVRPGRVTIDVLQSVLPDLNATFYLCGPAAFLADLTAQLHNAGVPEEQVVVESF